MSVRDVKLQPLVRLPSTEQGDRRFLELGRTYDVFERRWVIRIDEVNPSNMAPVVFVLDEVQARSLAAALMAYTAAPPPSAFK